MLDNANTRPSLHIPAADLAEGLKFLARAMHKKPSAPILSNVLFPGDGTMVATNLDMRAIWRFSDDTREDGYQMPFTVPHKSLAKVLKGASKGKMVTLTAHADDDGNIGNVAALADGLLSNFTAMPAEDFPVGGETLGVVTKRFRMSTSDLRDALRFTAPCMSDEETRYYLRGVFAHPARGVLTFTATDGHKLGHRPVPYSWEGDHTDDGRIIPTDTVKALLATFPAKPDRDLDLVFHKNGVTVQHGNWTLESRAVDGTFPDYTRVIPTTSNEVANVDTSETLASVKRLHGLSSRGAKAVAIDTADGLLEYRDEDRDTHKMPLSAKLEAGEGHRQGVNIDYLKAALETFGNAGADTVRVTAENAECPIKLDDPAQPNGALWVVMPMRLDKCW